MVCLDFSPTVLCFLRQLLIEASALWLIAATVQWLPSILCMECAVTAPNKTFLSSISIPPALVRSPDFHIINCDLRKQNPVGAKKKVTIRGALVGGRVVLYADWHYLHLLLLSKDKATKYTLWGLLRLLWAEEMRPLLGPKANDMTADLHGKYF